MANVYVYSGAGGAGTGADWTNAYTTLAAACTAKAAGDDFWVAHDHAETQASAMTITSPGTVSNPCRIICVDRAGSTPPVSADIRTTATISTTGSNGMILAGCANCEGITFNCTNSTGTGNLTVNNTTTQSWWFKNCGLASLGTGASNRIQLGNSGINSQLTRLTNTTIRFSATGQQITARERVIWEYTPSALLGTIPTTLFSNTSGQPCTLTLVGVDLSAAGSGKTLFDQSINSPCNEVNVIDCKLDSAVTIKSGTISSPGYPIIRIVNSDGADTNNRYERYSYEGTITNENTIVRTGGAPISLKMVSSANTRFYNPLMTDWIPFYSSTTGSKTVTVPIVTDNVTLKDNEAWVEVTYMGTASYPLGSLSSDAAADSLNAGTNQTTDATSTWTTTGLTTPVKQSLSTTFTTVKAGVYLARVCLAKASTTMYADPLIAAGMRQFMLPYGLYLNEEPSSGGITKLAGIGGGLVA